MRSVRAVGGVAVLAAALTGCSSGHDSSSSTPSSTSGAKSSSTSAAKTQVNPSSLVTGSTRPAPGVSTNVGKAATVPGDVKFVIGEKPFGPMSVSSSGLAQKVAGAVPETGVMSTVGSGYTLTASKATQRLAVVWMSKTSVLKVGTVGPCASSCPAQTAPAGTTSVMVIPASNVAGVGPDAPVSAG